MLTDGKYVCDATIKRAGAYEVCGREAVIMRAAKLGMTLHYCSRHGDRAVEPQERHFLPAPGSVPQLIGEAV